MQILFVHQNFPGQYRYLVQHFAQRQDWDVYAIGEKVNVKRQFYNIPKGVTLLGYDMPSSDKTPTHGPVHNFVDHVSRAQALANVLIRQKKNGLDPSIILAHPGWGEGLYLREIFPNAKLVYFFEYFFSTVKNTVNFDPEFPSSLPQQFSYRLSNATNLLSLDVADVGISPTRWQWSTYPEAFQSKMTVIHDGVDTTIVKPTGANQVAFIDIMTKESVTFSNDQEIISYSVRNLEPSRGFHRFMRALPSLQRVRPHARFIIIGGDEKSYSGSHPSGRPWREVLLGEVGERLDMDRIHFVGKVPYPRLLDLFSITHLHLYFTTPFVLSWSMMEAMACEAPVLASSTEPVIEVIEEGRNGFLFDFFDQEALVQRVDELMKQPKILSEVGRRARQSVIERYDLHSRCLPQHIALIESLSPVSV